MEEKEEKLSNAKRFLYAYNKIDESLRSQYNLKAGQSFSEVIRRCSSLNAIVRKFSDDLIDYGRLRNAIVHKSDDNFIIAEPHIKAVENLEKIKDLICTPPLALNTVCKKDVLSVRDDVSLKDVIGLMATSGYSNLPVYSDNSLIGVANGQRLINFIGIKINNKVNVDEYLSSTKIGDVVSMDKSDKYYMVKDINLTVDEAYNYFYSNRKLLTILITKTGNFMEPAIGIITVADIMDMNNLLESFSD
jgi:predicted transcriptional regulator